jgi:hypothetical protein
MNSTSKVAFQASISGSNYRLKNEWENEIYFDFFRCECSSMFLKVGAAAPQGDVKLKSGSREIFKYLKKKNYIADPLKKI